ncbi:hypothetical protein EPA93_41910 [Ktedonosporobacter rubrisoli]|uniref:Aminoglycoside phosphotransferase domain-containing protein n=1 Tax=Ktedonosporobacter rubrisoli TaxID=2509675 RepID=A0A4P6K369_KTERU|nr:aminoglycoside phosphotransferase family protein [Ktedonosporobacter rubrisoli]QBD82190.1 hypothetical protein EPA93_41910 [Ktedonosporobacter rubrisoli]
MDNLSTETNLSITDLPATLMQLFARAQRPLLSDEQGPVGLFIRYLRRKQDRGLAIIYSVDSLQTARKHRTNDPNRSVSLTLDEAALDGVHIRFSTSQARQTRLDLLPSGVLHLPDLGLSAQAFPADSNLPALAASCDTARNGPLFAALQSAARVQLEDPAWRLISASASPVRYKPASRCVLRYHLQLERTTATSEPTRRTLTLFGKVYANPAQAHSTQTWQQQLYAEQAGRESVPWLPRPLGLLADLGLTLNEAIEPPSTNGPDDIWKTLRTGLRALQPHILQDRGGVIKQIIIPEAELRLTAKALAQLHTSTLQLNPTLLRTVAKEAKRAQERARLIMAKNPEQAERIEQLVQQLSSCLEQLQPEAYRPAHGGFKPSQLLFHSQHVFIVDFDGFCLADPALDVGYFLAYLRPSGLWYKRPGMRQWFEGAAAVFRSAYQQAMSVHGVDPTTIGAIVDRSQLYEAALLFKIATRRVNRLNSPRPQELSTMLAEIATCLAQQSRRV